MAPRKGGQSGGRGRVKGKRDIDRYMVAHMMAQGMPLPQIREKLGNTVSVRTVYEDMEFVRTKLEEGAIKMWVTTREELIGRFMKLGDMATRAAELGLADGIAEREGRDDITPDRLIREGRLPSGTPREYRYGDPAYYAEARDSYEMAMRAIAGEFSGYNRKGTMGRKATAEVGEKLGIADFTFDVVMEEALGISPEVAKRAKEQMDAITSPR